MADSLTAGIEHLRRQPTDVVLLDLGLPESTGLDTLRRLLAEDIEMPALVVLSGLAYEELALRALDAGAQDYLVKGQVDGPAIARSVRFAISRLQAKAAPRVATAQDDAGADAAGRYAVYVNLSCELDSRAKVREALDRLAATLPEAFRVRSWTAWSPTDDMTPDEFVQDAPAPVFDDTSIATLKRIACGLEEDTPGTPRKLH